MINPGEIPQITGDLDAVASHGTTLQGQGKAFSTTGSDVHSTWQGLSAFYTAPEAAQLFAATGPVRSKTAAVGSDIASVGSALIAYADEVRPIKARLAALQAEAQTFVSSVAGDDSWRKDGDKVNHNNQLLSDVNGQVAAFMAAQRTCANRIDGLYGGTQYVEDNGDGTQAGNEFGYSADTLNAATASDQGVPWGKPDERDKPWYEDAWDSVYSFGKGFVVDGLWGTVKGLGNLVGFGGWDGMKASWGGLFKLGLALTPLRTLNDITALPGLPRGTLTGTLVDTGKALIDYDEWGKDPARASGAVVFNVVSVIFGTKGAGAGLKTVSAAAKGSRFAELATAGGVKVGELITGIKGKIPTLKLPGFLNPKVTVYAWKDPNLLVRLDHDFTDPLNQMGVPKPVFDADGNLVPANPAGVTQPYQHVLGNLDRTAKGNSPYSSWSVKGHDAKIYGGGNQHIVLNVDRLQTDIAAGKLPGVEVLPPDKVQASIQGAIDDAAKSHVDVTLPPEATPAQVRDFVDHLGVSKTAGKRLVPRIQAMLNSRRDGEWLIKGTIPRGYFEGPFTGPGR